jgi:hypothetical protein
MSKKKKSVARVRGGAAGVGCTNMNTCVCVVVCGVCVWGGVCKCLCVCLCVLYVSTQMFCLDVCDM